MSGSTARCASRLVGVNKSTGALYFHRLREIIALKLEAGADDVFGGEIEVDESYFGGRRKGKRGRGSAGKIAVFGVLKRGGRVYTKIIPNASSATLMPIIEHKVIPDSIVYSDCWRGYNVFNFDLVHSKHHPPRPQAFKAIISRQAMNHIQRARESSSARRSRDMRKRNGAAKGHKVLNLKECEWRFNLNGSSHHNSIITVEKSVIRAFPIPEESHSS